MAPSLAFFIHGMWRTSISAWPMLRQLRLAGLKTAEFNYHVMLETFPQIVSRLQARLAEAAADERMIVIGHSLGGVLARAALQGKPELGDSVERLFLLGSPVKPARLAMRLGAYFPFRVCTQDCGALLGSEERMASVGRPNVPITAIVGVSGFRGRFSPFGDEPNDGLVSVSEATTDWLDDVVTLEMGHTFLPASARTAAIVLERLSLANVAAPENATR